MNRVLTNLGFVIVLAGCGSSAPPGPAGTEKASSVSVAPEIRAVVDAADREPDDKALDRGRKPAELLSFFGLKRGMRVAELGASDGYTAELLGRAVGPSGVVYVHNTQWIMAKYAEEELPRRLAKPVNKHLVKVVRPFEDPLPPDAKDLDAVFAVLIYSATFWVEGGANRTKMNAAVLHALKPGGIYGIVSNSGRTGTGSTEAETFHRIEEKVVKDEILAAGFKLVAEGDFLRNPKDTRDWNASSFYEGAAKKGTPDRFVLRFAKP